MDLAELSADRVAMAEELSESSESSESSSSSGGGRAEPVANLPSFHSYKQLAADGKLADGNGHRFAEFTSRLVDSAELPMALDKPKDHAIQRNEVYNDSSVDEPSGGLFHAGVGAKEFQGQKEAMYSFCKEIREMRQKSLHAVLERTAGGAGTGKDIEFIKTYGLPLDRMKDLGFASRINSIALDKLRAPPIHGGIESSPAVDANELKRLQPRVGASGTTTTAFERLRHATAHPLFGSSEATSAVHFGHQQQQQQQHPLQQPLPSQPHAITHLGQIHQPASQHQQHQHQAKSFTIDAILGLRGGAQRDKHQRHHQYRKHQGQDSSAKNMSTSSCSNSGNNGSSVGGANGKLKRVRTIFTTEQLERLENEFARQQYMVGPERLYLAHALRLTEAQVKVWFQNRRIKWRKVNHEKQSQRLHELHHTSLSTERDDSNENVAEW